MKRKPKPKRPIPMPIRVSGDHPWDGFTPNLQRGLVAALLVLGLTATPAPAGPVLATAWLAAPTCGWAISLATAPGPFTPPCDGLITGVSTWAEAPGPLAFIVAEDLGTETLTERHRESREIVGGGTEQFAVPAGLAGAFWFIYAVPGEAHIYVIALEAPPTPTPEPATLGLLGLTLTALGWALRRLR